MPRHELHEVIGELISRENLPKFKVIQDSACLAENQQFSKRTIPLFCRIPKSSSVEYCNIDIAVVKDSTLCVIVEIEESAIKPIKICGKILASALAKYYVHKDSRDIPMRLADNMLFVQVLKETDRTTESRKAQWENLASSIQDELPIGSVSHYHLSHGTVNEFKGLKGSRLLDTIRQFLASS